MVSKGGHVWVYWVNDPLDIPCQVRLGHPSFQDGYTRLDKMPGRTNLQRGLGFVGSVSEKTMNKQLVVLCGFALRHLKIMWCKCPKQNPSQNQWFLGLHCIQGIPCLGCFGPTCSQEIQSTQKTDQTVITSRRDDGLYKLKTKRLPVVTPIAPRLFGYLAPSLPGHSGHRQWRVHAELH